MSTGNFKQVKRIHFIGIGGAGMGGIAEVLFNQHYEVTGSDLANNAMTQRLQRLGIKVWIGHNADNVIGADVVVITSAISANNPELIAAKEKHIPVIPRAQMLADLMRFKQGIAVAGTHGKTTTTSLVASILAEAGLDPTFVIGGLLKSAGTHAYLGTSKFFVAEADESDASFLYLYPQAAIVTNIDADHLATYNNDFNKLRQTFIEFLHRLPFNGLAVVCIDDAVINEILPEIARPTLTYGFSSSADIQIIDFQQTGVRSTFKLRHKTEQPDVEISLNLAGRHNVLNAAAAYAIAQQIGVATTAIQNALAKFAGVARRLQIYGDIDVNHCRVTLVDDYGHHPGEIVATLTAVRNAWPNHRLVMAYQPHRYSRTQALFNDFVKVLSEQADLLLLLDIYSAGESATEINGELLFNAIKQTGKCETIFVKQIEDLPEILTQVLLDHDVLVTQGAGNIGAMAAKLATDFKVVESTEVKSSEKNREIKHAVGE